MTLDQVLDTECPECGRTYPLAHAILDDELSQRRRKVTVQQFAPHSDELCRPCQREKGLIA